MFHDKTIHHQYTVAGLRAIKKGHEVLYLTHTHFRDISTIKSSALNSPLLKSCTRPTMYKKKKNTHTEMKSDVIKRWDNASVRSLCNGNLSKYRLHQCISLIRFHLVKQEHRVPVCADVCARVCLCVCSRPCRQQQAGRRPSCPGWVLCRCR